MTSMELGSGEYRIGRYRIGRKLGFRLFREVYLGTHDISGEEIAIKLEYVEVKRPQLEYEASVYQSLSGGVGIPIVRWYGTDGVYNAMVLDIVGPSLEELFIFCERKLSLKSVLLLADKLISRLKGIHATSFIHGDIKLTFSWALESVAIRLMSLTLVSPRSIAIPKRIFTFHTGRIGAWRGTARYASINAHLRRRAVSP